MSQDGDFRDYNILLIYFHVVIFFYKKGRGVLWEGLRSELQLMKQARDYQAKSKGLVGLLEDDTILHPHFCTELTKTFADLSPSWEVLHLCPGFVWGKRFSDHESRPVEFRPERKFHLKGFTSRVWDRPPDKEAWLGGPDYIEIPKVFGFLLWSTCVAEWESRI